MPIQIQLRRDTAANWTSTNPTLAAGELGVETDTKKIKFGDGTTAWTALAYSGAGTAVAQVAVVAADVTHTQSNTTLSNVTGLLVPIGASATEIWFFEAFLLMSAASATPDVKYGFTVPASCTMQWGATGDQSLGPTFGRIAAASAPTVLGAAGATLGAGLASGTAGIALVGYIFGGGTGGNVQLQFAQNTSDASDVKVLKGSMLRYTKVVA